MFYSLPGNLRQVREIASFSKVQVSQLNKKERLLNALLSRIILDICCQGYLFKASIPSIWKLV